MQITSNFSQNKIINTNQYRNNTNINYSKAKQNINFTSNKLNFIEKLKFYYNITKCFIRYIKTSTKQNLSNMQKCHVSILDYLKGSFFCDESFINPLFICPFEKILATQKLGTVQLKCRNNQKTVKAKIEKLDLGNGKLIYLLLRNNRQIGYLKAVKNKQDIVIDYITNILARKKYKNTENILVQSLIEDCASQGFIPRIIATPVTLLNDRKISNYNLYQRMGMLQCKDYFLFGSLEIFPEQVLKLAQQRAKKNGEIIKNSILSFKNNV